MGSVAWLFRVAGGAAILGGAVAFGMFKRNPKLTAFSMGGAIVVAVFAGGISLVVLNVPTTATNNPPDRSGSHDDTPARPSDQNALPGLNQPNR